MSEVEYWQVVKCEGLKITLKRSTDSIEKDVSKTVEKKIKCKKQLNVS